MIEIDEVILNEVIVFDIVQLDDTILLDGTGEDEVVAVDLDPVVDGSNFYQDQDANLNMPGDDEYRKAVVGQPMAHELVLNEKQHL